MLGLWEAVVGVAVTIVLAAVATIGRSLTPAAGAVAAAFGSIIVVLGGFPYLGILALFVLASALATRFHFDEKSRRSLQEGTHGERGIPNVLAHIFLPTALVLYATIDPTHLPPPALSFLYTAAIAFGASDTFASELGVLSGSARSILTGRPVPPGTNGGISGQGEFFALIGAWTTAVVALALFLLFSTPTPGGVLFIAGATGAGFAACQIDSVLGETLENRGYLTKGSTNFLAMACAILIGVAVLSGTGVLVW